MIIRVSSDPNRNALLIRRAFAVSSIRMARETEARHGVMPEPSRVEEWDATLRRLPLDDERLQTRLLRIIARWRASSENDVLAIYRAARAEAEGDR